MSFQDLRELWESTFGDLERDTMSVELSYRPDWHVDLLEAPGPVEFHSLELLARGGMGEVYRARQTGLGREVALKRIRRDRKGASGARRSFVNEAVVTGRLEHPNIVPVYALGAHAPGDLFMAMKLVGGVSWKARLKEQPEDLQGHLETLIQVCNAVAFAHSRAIIHNDLKPANVMLGAFGEVLVLDWGLAVDVSPEPDADARVRHRSAVQVPFGTPCYIAPELALGKGEQLGPWTDVYLLGAILYEILTGRPPHQADSLVESLRRAVEESPLPLLEEVNRPRELVEICTKALARDPADRHTDAREFLDELRTYLRHRESNRIAALARERLADCEEQAEGEDAARLRNALYEGFAESVAGFAQARRLWKDNEQATRGERRARVAYARTALRLGDLGLAEAQLARLRTLFPDVPAGLPAPARSKGPDSLDGLEGELSSARWRKERERRARRRLKLSLVAVSLALFLGLTIGLVQLDQKNRQIAAQNDSIRASRDQLRLEKEAAEELRRKAEDQRQLAETLRGYADRRGEIAQRALERLSVEVQSRLLDELADAHAHRTAREILQIVLASWREMRDANIDEEQVSAAAADARVRISDLLFQLDGDIDGALAELQAAWEMYEALDGDLQHRHHATVQLRLARLYRARGNLQQARICYEAALEPLRTLHDSAASVRTAQDLVSALVNLGQILSEQEDHAAEEARFAEAVTLIRWLRARTRDDHATRRKLANDLLMLGRINRGQGDPEGARAAIEEGLALARELVADEPGHPLWQHDLSKALEEMALLHYQTRDDDAARDLFEEAIAIHRHLLYQDPGNAHERLHMAGTLRNLATVQNRRGETATSLLHYAEAEELLRGLLASEPENASVRSTLAGVLEAGGRVERSAGSPGPARAKLAEAAGLRRQLVALDSTNVGARRDLIWSLRYHADACWAAGEEAAALELREEAVRRARQLAAEQPENVALQELLASNLRLLADVCWNLVDARTVGFYEQARDARERAAALDRGDRTLHEALVANAVVALAYEQSERPDEALTLFFTTLERARSFVRDFPDSTRAPRAHAYLLRTSLEHLGTRPADAERDEAIATLAAELDAHTPHREETGSFLRSFYAQRGEDALVGDDVDAALRWATAGHDQALADGAGQAEAARDLADVLRLSGAFEAALQRYGTAPGLGRALTLLHLERTDEARAELAALPGPAPLVPLLRAALGDSAAVAALVGDDSPDGQLARVVLGELDEDAFLGALEADGLTVGRAHIVLAVRHEQRDELDLAASHYEKLPRLLYLTQPEAQWAWARLRQWARPD